VKQILKCFLPQKQNQKINRWKHRIGRLLLEEKLSQVAVRYVTDEV